jgi:hypothetical protein
MTQVWKKGLFLRNTECGFCAIACFSETRDGRKSKNEESRKQKFKEDWGAELAGGNLKMEDRRGKIAALPPPLDCGVTSGRDRSASTGLRRDRQVRREPTYNKRR